MATPKTQKNQKNCARRAYERGSDIEKLFEKPKTITKDFIRLLLVALRFSMRARGFFLLLFNQGLKR